MKDVKPEEIFLCLPYSEYLVRPADLDMVLKALTPANVGYNGDTDTYDVREVKQYSDLNLRIISGAGIIAAQARKKLEG